MNCCHNSSEDILHTDWSHEPTRRHFISKVCSIVALQLAFTAAVTAIFVFIEAANTWLKEHMFVFFIAAFGCFVISMVLCCCPYTARSVPLNYLLLIGYTLCESIIVSAISIYYTTDKILLALGITVVVCIGLALFALFAPCDFTGCGPFLCVLMIILVLMGFVNFFIRSSVFHLIIVCFGLILFCMYLVYDIQLMVGNNTKYSYSEEDYIIAALNIYIDIIRIFLYILILLGLLDD